MLRRSDRSRRAQTKSSNVYGESQPKRIESPASGMPDMLVDQVSPGLTG
jgi:hypothetical protein